MVLVIFEGGMVQVDVPFILAAFAEVYSIHLSVVRSERIEVRLPTVFLVN